MCGRLTGGACRPKAQRPPHEWRYRAPVWWPRLKRNPLPHPGPAPEFVGFDTRYINEFHTNDGQHVVLDEAVCTEITFRPVQQQLVATFAFALESSDDIVLTFDEAQILLWEDKGDGPDGLPDGWPAEARGQADIDLIGDNFILMTLNAQVSFTATRVSYRIVPQAD